MGHHDPIGSELARLMLLEARNANSDARSHDALHDGKRGFAIAIDERDLDVAAGCAVEISRAYSTLDAQSKASKWALLGAQIAVGAEPRANAWCQYYETLEIRRYFSLAAEYFLKLKRNLPDTPWAADLRGVILNHEYSLGVKLQDPSLADGATRSFADVAGRMTNEDDYSAAYQWSAIWDICRGAIDEATEKLGISDRHRSQGRRRQTTKLFPHAHLAAAQGDLSEAARLLDTGILWADGLDLRRYVRAGGGLRVQLGLA